MWYEIKQTAKVHLIRVLWDIKIWSMTIDGLTSKVGEELRDYQNDQPPSEIGLIQWRCIMDLFIENKFI